MAVTPTFLWHDYETFGANPRRDRPAQFAGVRTDMDLNLIGDPVSLYCAPTDDFLPEPDAVLITGITPQMARERGVIEAEFIGRIHAELAAPGTCGVGYNTLRFDDELTRHLLWRNLYEPYGREWQQGCSRWDLLDCARAAYAFRPETIQWPLREDGAPSFKLEHLTAANGLAHDAAHDALSDVLATIGFAKLIKTTQPRLFDFCFKLRKKDAVQDEMRVVERRPFLHISGMYPASRGCLAVVLPLGWHPTNRNELAVWDLSVDPTEFLALDAEQIRARLFTRTEDLAEGETRLPIKTIHINRSPVVVGNLRALSDARAAELGIDLALADKHATQLIAAGDLSAILEQVYTRPTGDTAPARRDVDEALYDGFLAEGDKRRLDQMRGKSPAVLADTRAGFDDPRLEEIVFRYRARNWPDTLSDVERQRWQTHRAERLLDGAGGVLNLATLRNKVAEIEQARPDDARAHALLADVLAWAAEQEASLGAP
ncbi:MAG: exodeoxyribonuclease I [Burkholderiales bacterium]|nr:exodeoxyribonuclease I [Burkholderiales bacterium]